MRTYLVLLCLFLTMLVHGQDHHFSMFSFASANLNPALTGIFEHDHSESDFRTFVNYRNQWRSIKSPYVAAPTPFSTYSISSDVRLRWLRVLRHNCIGIGAMAYRDKAGDLNFGTTQFSYSISFQKSIGDSHRDFLTFGFQQSIVQRSLDFTNASFDSQWNGKGYDPSLATGEQFPSPQFYYNDMNIGVSYVYRPLKQDDPHWMIGFSSFHMNRPNQSFYNGIVEVSLKRKWILHGSGRYLVKKKYILYPVFMLAKQGQANEVNITGYIGKRTDASDLQIRLGLGYRLVSSLERDVKSDALITALWFLYKQWDMGVSYDSNFSGLTRATAVKGGLEVFIIFHERLDPRKSKFHPTRNRMPKCPSIYDE